LSTTLKQRGFVRSHWSVELRLSKEREKHWMVSPKMRWKVLPVMAKNWKQKKSRPFGWMNIVVRVRVRVVVVVNHKDSVVVVDRQSPVVVVDHHH